jgi:hypothetical protein
LRQVESVSHLLFHLAVICLSPSIVLEYPASAVDIPLEFVPLGGSAGHDEPYLFRDPLSPLIVLVHGMPLPYPDYWLIAIRPAVQVSRPLFLIVFIGSVNVKR